MKEYGQTKGRSHSTNNPAPLNIEHGDVKAARLNNCMCLRCQDAIKRHVLLMEEERLG